MIQLAIVPRMDGDDAQFINVAFIGVLSRTPTPEETGA